MLTFNVLEAEDLAAVTTVTGHHPTPYSVPSLALH
jgi:hypothetical protein